MYLGDLKTKHAVERNFSIIGEAVARIDERFRDKYPSVDWREVKDFRNIIIHDSFVIDDAIVWDIINLNLDQLEKGNCCYPGTYFITDAMQITRHGKTLQILKNNNPGFSL